MRLNCVLSLAEAMCPSTCFATRICSYISSFSRVLAEVEVPVVKAKRLTLAARFMPLFKAAAVVAVVLSLGNVMQHSFFSDVEEVAATDTIGKQISAPSVALSGDVPVSHEKQVMDSLRRVNKELEIKE